MPRSRKSSNEDVATVLIAEDSRTQAVELTFVLESHGFGVLHAIDGVQALDMARACEPDLVISDIVMPRMDGYELCRSIKQDADLSETPVILVTSLSSPHDVFKGLDAGADNFIMKPYEEEHLISRIDYIVANRKLRRSGNLQVGIEIELSGQRHFITAERQQVLDLLISTYDQAVRLYDELDVRQKELSRSYGTLNALYGFTEGLNRCRTEREVAENAIERGVRLPGVRAAWMHVREGDGLRLAAARGATPAMLDAAATGEIQRRLLRGDLDRATNVLEYEAAETGSDGAPFFASVPLVVDGGTVGLFTLVGDGTGRFSDDELRMLTSVGNQIGIALERARLHSELERKVQERTAALQAEVVERRHAEAVARQAEERLLDAISSISDGFVLFDREDGLVLCNDRFREMNAVVADRLVPGARYEDLVQAFFERGGFAGDDAQARQAWRDCVETHRTGDGTRLLQPRGDRWLMASERRTRDGGTVGARTDITELKRSQDAAAEQARRSAAIAVLGQSALRARHLDALLAEAAELLTSMLGAAGTSVLEWDATADAFVLRAVDGASAGAPGEPCREAAESILRRAVAVPDGVVAVSDWSREARYAPPARMPAGTGASLIVTVPGMRRGETPFGIVAVDAAAPRNFTEEDVSFVGTVANVLGMTIERLHHERRFRDASETLSAILDSSPVAIVALDRDGKVITWNRSAEMIFGYSTEEVVGLPHPPITEDGGDGDPWDAVRTGDLTAPFVTRLRHKDGSVLDVRASAELLKDADGGHAGRVLAIEDISERRRIEEQLRQAQKMEAIGNLTGGIAHDFNNLLAITIGNLELLEMELEDAPSALDLVDRALQASLRGADLTRQLLAFSRRQTLQSRVVDVGQLARGMVNLLGRTLGEHIEIDLSCHGDLWPVLIDPAQLDAAIVNLAVNARDAMPNGGRLTIEIRNVTADETFSSHHPGLSPGCYVAVSVTDTGAGIPEEVQQRIFEPFFTTKAVGAGTGLGLSMVYGFVTQSGGHVTVYSELGRGTTIRLYLPRAFENDIERADAGETKDVHDGRTRAGSKVLLVEDKEEVRHTVARHLLELGYAVIEASNAADALALLEAGTVVDLLFTDVVMPGAMSGLDLAKLVRARWPDLKILLTSGFPESALKPSDGLSAFAMLGKPYRKAELARHIGTILASSR